MHAWFLGPEIQIIKSEIKSQEFSFPWVSKLDNFLDPSGLVDKRVVKT